VRVVAIFPMVTATTLWPRDFQHLTRCIDLVCHDAVPILGHGACQEVGRVKKCATQLSARKGKGVMAQAGAQTAHTAPTIAGISEGLRVQGLNAFAVRVVHNALNI